MMSPHDGKYRIEMVWRRKKKCYAKTEDSENCFVKWCLKKC